MPNDPTDNALWTDLASVAKWNWVSRGLSLKLGALTLSALIVVAIGVLVVVNPQTLSTSSVGYWFLAGFFVALIIDFTGRSLCGVAPLTQSARAWIVASIGCQFCAIVAFVTVLLTIPEIALPARISLGILLAGMAHSLAAFFFVLFARRIAVSFGRNDLAFTPAAVFFLFGSSISTSMIVMLVLGVLLLCPCVWWYLFIAIGVVQRGWIEYGLPENLVWPLTRLIPTLLVAVLFGIPVFGYARMLLQLRKAIDTAFTSMNLRGR